MTALVLALRGAAAIGVLTMVAGGMPRIVRLGLAVAAGLWTALVVEPAMVDGSGLAVITVREIAIGAALGIAAAVPLMAAAMAGRLVDFAGGGSGPYGALFGVLAAAVFVGIDGQVAAIAAIGESFRVVPAIGEAQPGAIEAIGGIVGAAVGLAIPWLVTAAVVEIAVGVGARVGARAAVFAPAGAAVPAALAMITAALIATLAVGIAALVR